jgi:hypothetical protein
MRRAALPPAVFTWGQRRRALRQNMSLITPMMVRVSSLARL